MRKRLAATINVLIYLFILSPILIIIPASFGDAEIIAAIPERFSLRWYRNFLDTPELVSAMLLSFRLAAVSMAIALAIGLLAALALVRFRFPGRDAARALVMAPMVIPGLILGLALLIFFSRIRLAGTFGSLVLAHVVVCVPYAIRTLSAGLQGMDEALVQAAMSLGATRLVAFRTITLPLLKAAVLASAIFTFVTSLDELVVTLFLTGPRLSTLPVEMYNYIEVTSDPTIAAISVLLIVFTSAVVLIVERLVGFGDLT
jgi:putative spermidine/putrescine transport system permease protein